MAVAIDERIAILEISFKLMLDTMMDSVVNCSSRRSFDIDRPLNDGLPWFVIYGNIYILRSFALLQFKFQSNAITIRTFN